MTTSLIKNAIEELIHDKKHLIAENIVLITTIERLKKTIRKLEDEVKSKVPTPIKKTKEGSLTRWAPFMKEVNKRELMAQQQDSFYGEG